MVESIRRVPRQQLRSAGDSSEQSPSLSEVVANAVLNAELNAKQRKAWGIITTKMDFSDPNLPPHAAALMLLTFSWHDSDSLATIKRITGISNDKDALDLANRVGESDELTELYKEFYSLYRAPVRKGE